MFGDLKLELGRNFKVPHMLGVLIHLKTGLSRGRSDDGRWVVHDLNAL
jgi:hypothetical protein